MNEKHSTRFSFSNSKQLLLQTGVKDYLDYLKTNLAVNIDDNYMILF